MLEEKKSRLRERKKKVSIGLNNCNMPFYAYG